MEYEDRIRLETPEGLALDLQLAGVGSRGTAALVDGLIQLLAIAALAAITAPAGAAGSAVLAVVAFLLIVGYDVAFETANGGRTPGKQLVGLRVVRVGGEPITLPAALVRNLMRLVDFLPVAYGVGLVAILSTQRNQRLGDLAAGALVVRERRAADAVVAAPRTARLPLAAREETARWDATGVPDSDLAVARSFLERRASLPDPTRDEIARRLAARLRALVVGVDPHLDDEVFLEWLVALRAGGGDDVLDEA